MHLLAVNAICFSPICGALPRDCLQCDEEILGEAGLGHNSSGLYLFAKKSALLAMDCYFVVKKAGRMDGIMRSVPVAKRTFLLPQSAASAVHRQQILPMTSCQRDRSGGRAAALYRLVETRGCRDLE